MNSLAHQRDVTIISEVSSMINLTAEQLHLAKQIDAHVNQYPGNAIGDEHLLPTIYDYMGVCVRTPKYAYSGVY